jgi:cell volume regulation protein A
MNIITTIIILGLLIFFSHAFNELFSRTKIPNVLLLLLIGIVIGPISGAVTKDFFGKLGNVFTTITLIVILFESGANLKFKDIKETIGSASMITLINFVVTMSITALVGRYLLSLNPVNAVFVGAVCGGTSSAVVIPMVKQLKLGERSSSILILESALSDVLCLVVGLALLEGMAKDVVSVGAIFSKMWKAFLFAILIGIAGGFVWSFLIRLIRTVKSSMMTTLAFVFILYGVVELMGFNGGLAVLSCGIILGNAEVIVDNKFFRKIFKTEISGFNEKEKDFFAEIVFIMQTYFFVYVGIALQFGAFGIYAASFLIVILIIIFRAGVTFIFAGRKVVRTEKTIMSVMMPKGLIPAVLASIPLQRGLFQGAKILDLGYSIVLVSIVICSILVIIFSINPDFHLFLFKRKNKQKTRESETPEQTGSTPQ